MYSLTLSCLTQAGKGSIPHNLEMGTLACYLSLLANSIFVSAQGVNYPEQKLNTWREATLKIFLSSKTRNFMDRIFCKEYKMLW
jgi:hypothetical protein